MIKETRVSMEAKVLVWVVGWVGVPVQQSIIENQYEDEDCMMVLLVVFVRQPFS